MLLFLILLSHQLLVSGLPVDQEVSTRLFHWSLSKIWQQQSIIHSTALAIGIKIQLIKRWSSIDGLVKLFLMTFLSPHSGENSILGRSVWQFLPVFWGLQELVKSLFLSALKPMFRSEASGNCQLYGGHLLQVYRAWDSAFLFVITSTPDWHHERELLPAKVCSHTGYGHWLVVAQC